MKDHFLLVETIKNSNLNVEEGTITFDTKTGYFSVDGGAHGESFQTSHSYVDDSGLTWNYEVSNFIFSQFRLGSETKVILKGNRPLSIQTVSNGEIYIGSDLILDGGNASDKTDMEAMHFKPLIGRSSQNVNGDGPGGPGPSGASGTGANYNYGNEQISDLMGGSSGSSGRNFQGSGAGGGALELRADGDLTIARSFG